MRMMRSAVVSLSIITLLGFDWWVSSKFSRILFTSSSTYMFRPPSNISPFDSVAKYEARHIKQIPFLPNTAGIG